MTQIQIQTQPESIPTRYPKPIDSEQLMNNHLLNHRYSISATITTQESFDNFISSLSLDNPTHVLTIKLSQNFQLSQSTQYNIPIVYMVNLESDIPVDYPNITFSDLKVLDLSKLICYDIPQLPTNIISLTPPELRNVNIKLSDLTNLKSYLQDSGSIRDMNEFKLLFQNNQNIKTFRYSGNESPNIEPPLNIEMWNAWSISPEFPFREELYSLSINKKRKAYPLAKEYFQDDAKNNLDGYSGNYIELPKNIRRVEYYDGCDVDWSEYKNLRVLYVTSYSTVTGLNKDLEFYSGPVFEDMEKYEKLKKITLDGDMITIKERMDLLKKKDKK